MPAGLEKGTALSCTELRIEPLYFQRPFHPEILTYFYNFSSRARERGKLYTLFTPRKIIIRASKLNLSGNSVTEHTFKVLREVCVYFP